MKRAQARLSRQLHGDGLRARALRSSAYAFLNFGGAKALRLASNLILTRILFPEAFGLMALVQVVLTGLEMFSDTGIHTSIVQNKRGDEASFLNTAWTIQILRGILLWLIVVAAAGPLAQFYAAPQLAELLPVAGVTAILAGLQSTKLASANRHLNIGRLTALELGSQFLGILSMIALALWSGSVWALVLGGLAGSTAKTLLSHIYLPGTRNRLQWDASAFQEIFNFGKFIFISSGAGFLISNGDRAILGKFVNLTELAVYNIGFFLAAVPIILSRQLGARVLLPIYAAAPPHETAENRHKTTLARAGLTSVLIGLGLSFGMGGDWLVRVLYEPNYHLAGPITVLLSLAFLPFIVTHAYGTLLLAAGNSRLFTIQQITIATVQSLALLIGVREFGLIGAVAAPPLTALLVYPFIALCARRHGGWNPSMDAGFLAIILLGSVLVLWVNDTAIAQVLAGVPN